MIESRKHTPEEKENFRILTAILGKSEILESKEEHAEKKRKKKEEEALKASMARGDAEDPFQEHADSGEGFNWEQLEPIKGLPEGVKADEPGDPEFLKDRLIHRDKRAEYLTRPIEVLMATATMIANLLEWENSFYKRHGEYPPGSVHAIYQSELWWDFFRTGECRLGSSNDAIGALGQEMALIARMGWMTTEDCERKNLYHATRVAIGQFLRFAALLNMATLFGADSSLIGLIQGLVEDGEVDGVREIAENAKRAIEIHTNGNGEEALGDPDEKAGEE